MKKFNNRTTGPTDFPPEVYQVLNQPIISHRSVQFKETLQRATERMQKLLNTKNIPMFFTTSGTGGLEATLLNTLTKNSKVLSLSNGYYGNLWARIAQKHSPHSVVKENFSPGCAIYPERVREILKKNTFDVILLTHSESSTGVLNDLSALTKVIKENSDALILVDAISSVGTTPCYMDVWNVDVLVTVPQKGLMAPPGLAIICGSPRAIQQSKQQDALGSFYFDFSQTLEAGTKNQTPTTPNILGVLGVDAALARMEKEGFSEVFDRHKHLSTLCQQGISNLGLELFAEENFRAPGITAIRLPENISALKAQKYLEEQCGLLVTTGLSEWTDYVLRVGHMGWVSEDEIRQALSAISQWIKNEHNYI